MRKCGARCGPRFPTPNARLLLTARIRALERRRPYGFANLREQAGGAERSERVK
jgi:hypothetical protein